MPNTHRSVARARNIIERVTALIIAIVFGYLAVVVFMAPCWVNVNPEVPQWISITGACAMALTPACMALAAVYWALAPSR